MSLRPSRLDRGELAAALAAAALLALMAATGWLHLRAGVADGWSALPALRWPLVVTAALGLSLAAAQMACEAPALPVCIAAVAIPLGALSTIALAVRLAFGAGSVRAGAYAGLVCGAALTVAAFRSLRREGGWLPGPERPIETIAIGASD